MGQPCHIGLTKAGEELATLDRKNCVQVFVNTGPCDAGLRDFGNRRIGNTGDASTSTAFDQPEFIGQRRSLSTGITVNF